LINLSFGVFGEFFLKLLGVGIPSFSTCYMHHPLGLIVEAQEFLVTVGKAFVRVRPILVEQ